MKSISIILLILALASVSCSDASPAANSVASDGNTTVRPATGDIQTPGSPQPDQLAPAPGESPTRQLHVATPANTAAPADVAPGGMPLSGSGAGPYSTEQLRSFNDLLFANPPERDELEVARLYLGWAGTLQPTPVPAPLDIGAQQTIRVRTHNENRRIPVNIVLLARGEHAYFWFEKDGNADPPSTSRLREVADAFDDIYTRAVSIYGSEPNPGIDGDSRLHIVNISPRTLCDQPDGSDQHCNVAGYFSAEDHVPASIDPGSNAREMFVMSTVYLDSDFYLNVLAHEFRHMIESNQDLGDQAWVTEGGASLAEDLLGFSNVSLTRANLFLEQPDQQLNHWTEDFTIPLYGQGYLLNRYIYDRLGDDFYRRFSSSPATGLAAVDEVARQWGLSITGEDLWLDWLVALAVHDNRRAAAEFKFTLDGLNTASMSEIAAPVELEETVHQYAADYYAIQDKGNVTLTFEGQPLVPLLDIEPIEGDHFWVTDRANFSHMTLSRAFDLSDVTSAWLTYDVYFDIEAGYDFAYVFVSEDDGATWQPLVGGNMLGLAPEDDPSGSALYRRFYTGRSEDWRSERINLTPYAGGEIQIRFAYLTDLVLNYRGLALDNIAVQQVDFYDNAESEVGGWDARGFQRVIAQIPQRLHLQLITFQDHVPYIERIPVVAGDQVIRRLNLSGGMQGALLIVAASTPQTLQQAHYTITLSE